jgi:hypothetical protein
MILEGAAMTCQVLENHERVSEELFYDWNTHLASSKHEVGMLLRYFRRSDFITLRLSIKRA